MDYLVLTWIFRIVCCLIDHFNKVRYD